MTKRKSQQAFTLLEILVVISIIGILIALGTAAFTTAQRKGRDARRQSDMKTIQDGYEQFYAKNGVYPVSAAEAAAETDIFPAGLPSDPKNRDSNVYSFESDIDGFCLCALLESSAGNSSALPDAGDLTTCQFGTGDYHCTTNLQ